MEALRWILLLIGLLLIAVIYWLGRRQGQDNRREGLFERARRAAREDRGDDATARGPVEPDLDIADLDVHGFDVEGRPGEARESPHPATPSTADERPGSRGRARDAAGSARDATQAPDDPSADPAPEVPAEGARGRDTGLDAGPDSGPEPDSEPDPAPAREPETVTAAGRGTDRHAGRPPESGWGPATAPDPRPDRGPDPGPGADPEPDPVVTRIETPPREPEAPETPASVEAPGDNAPAAAGRHREEQGTRGQTTGGAVDERVVVLHVVAPEGERLVGGRLREALESCGLRHGAYSIFHASDSEGSIVFSAANAIEPGTFDRATMDTLTTPGIALFMQVPGAQSAETVFDRMLSTARSVADALEAQVLDERHSTLTRQTEQHLREELRLLDRRTGSLQR